MVLKNSYTLIQFTSIAVDVSYWNCPQEKNSSAVISLPDQGAQLLQKKEKTGNVH